MSIFTSRKFRVDILTIFITLFLISILGITYYFYTRSNTAILKVANGFISRTIDSISQKIDDFLQPLPLSSISGLIMNDQRLDSNDMKSLSSYMHVVLKAYPQLVNAYIADLSGNVFIENRITDLPLPSQFIPFIEKQHIPANARFVSELVTPVKGGSAVKLIFKDEAGLAIATDQIPLVDFDPRKRPWYEDAKNSNQTIWIGIYPFFGMKEKVITIAFPVIVNGIFKGVAAADINVSSIKNAMDKFSIDAKGVVFIDNHHGQVIASEDEDLYEDPDKGLSTVYKTKNKLIKKAFAMHVETAKENFTFELDGVKYIAYFKTYSISKNETWDIAAVVPINVFVGSIDRVNKRALIFSLSTLLIGLILVVISSNKISKPIMQIAEETQDIQHFNFSKMTTIKSHIYEVQVMVAALNIAKTALFSFSKYVPKMLVDQLLRMGNIAEVGGEKKNITIMFSDIKNFTQISEQTDPNDLMHYLSEYLNVLTHCVHEYHGNIDKYIGDSIMAFWGAPQSDPHQIVHACLALLACQREVKRLCKQAREEGRPMFATRFGLNVGSAIVGNLGSTDRLNYTAIGKAVNLASRLENINSTYETDIIVSEAVYLASYHLFLFRPLDLVQIKGINEPVQIYELIAENADGKNFPATADQLEFCQIFNDAYRLFHAKQYKLSLELWRGLIAKYPDDYVTRMYIKRCEEVFNKHS